MDKELLHLEKKPKPTHYPENRWEKCQITYKHTDECFHWKTMERDVMVGLGRSDKY